LNYLIYKYNNYDLSPVSCGYLKKVTQLFEIKNIVVNLQPEIKRL